MVEKIAASVAAAVAVVLAIWAKMTFVRRSEIYAQDGKPVYRHSQDCAVIQNSCNKLICNKIDDIKSAQRESERKRDLARKEIYDQLRTIQVFMGRVEQYMRDH